MALLAVLALAAETWQPTCAGSADPTAWWVLEAQAPAPVPDFVCPDQYLGAVACSKVVAVASLRWPTAPGATAPAPELRYLPYGQTAQILAFLDRAEGGVVQAPPEGRRTVTAGDLFAAWLDHRRRASQAETGVTLHLWTCPDADPLAPEAHVPMDMPVRRHYARVGPPR